MQRPSVGDDDDGVAGLVKGKRQTDLAGWNQAQSVELPVFLVPVVVVVVMVRWLVNKKGPHTRRACFKPWHWRASSAGKLISRNPTLYTQPQSQQA